MKDMIKRIREEREGFTLAELLIVVAIIAVLVAIAIPVFNGQLEKSREAVDEANIRSAYAEVSAAALTDSDTDATSAVKRTGTAGSYVWTKSVKLEQKQDGWQNTEIVANGIGGVAVTDAEAKAGKYVNVIFTQNTGKVTYVVADSAISLS